MRLAVVSLMEDVPWGGSEELWAATASAALALGDEVALELPVWPEVPMPVQRLLDAGAEPLWRPPRGTVAAPLGLRILHGVRRRSSVPPEPETMVDRLARFEPDVVCISQGVTYTVGRPDVHDLLQRLPWPYLLLTNGSDDRHDVDPDERARLQRSYGGAAAAGFPTPATQRCAERQMSRTLPDAFLFDYPNVMVDLGPLPWPDLPDRGTVELAYVGRVSVAKGIDGLFQTLGTAKWRERDFRLRLFGEVHGDDYFDELARAYGIADRVQLCGYTDDVAGVWADSHLLVFPSRMEGAPIAVAEAMFCGRAAVATAVGAIPDWITDGHSGFLAAGPDPRQLDDALERAWQARAQWPEMGGAAHAAIRTAVDPARAASDLLERLEKMAVGGR